MAEVLVLSGAGVYADPWHAFPETSARLAGLIGDLGYAVELSVDVEARLTVPGQCRLLVLNIGNPAEPTPAGVVAAVHAGLRGYLDGGGALLGIHSTSTSLTAMSEWPAILGGHWVRGVSMHPPRGEARVLRTGLVHPISAGLGDFTVHDERYSYLSTQPDSTVLYEHEYEGRRHPLVWVREGARVGYDALGHDVDSYRSSARITLLERMVRWLLGDL